MRAKLSERLERALAAAGSATPRTFGDGSSEAQHVAAASPRTKTLWHHSSGAHVDSFPEGRTDPDDDFLDDGGPASFESSPFVPTDVLRERRRALEERLEMLQTDSLKTRSLLRECEAMVQRSIAEAPDDDDAGGAGAATSSAAPTPRATAVAYGGRLLPSSWTPRSTLAGRAGAAGPAGGGGASSVPEWAGVSMAAGGARPPTSPDDLKQQRLLRCDHLQAALQPVRRDLDEYSASLGDAHAGNARLQAALDSAFTFTEAEIQAELAAQAREAPPADAAAAATGAGAGLKVRAGAGAGARALAGTGAGATAVAARPAGISFTATPTSTIPPSPPVSLGGADHGGLRAALGALGQQPRRASAAQAAIARVSVSEAMRAQAATATSTGGQPTGAAVTSGLPARAGMAHGAGRGGIATGRGRPPGRGGGRGMLSPSGSPESIDS